ncbi:platelet-activating factor acetylhydrolase, isoform II domain-containing protein [Sarocladium implicatum]|nr:platelet-activating factor acetylhydrolase, isoform II domain-containing protein [Sarocladium implicatum]
MAGYLSSLSPIPAFPDYTGPYKVGTVDVEIPVSEVPSPANAPDAADGIETIQFRIFYPAVDASNQKYISWLPAPQRHHVSAYTRFLGFGGALAELFSFIPRHLHYTTIPARKNASLREPTTENHRWPTMIFSHGLGGGRNSYSYIAGSLASHGVVVVCPEHRDGSAVTTFMRMPNQKPTDFKSRVIPYQRHPHDASPEVFAARDNQLRVRLWEMGLMHQAVLALDRGFDYTNLNTSTTGLGQFAGKLHVNDPGSIIWAGHSFGATTMTSLLKSTYYADRPEVAKMDKPLFQPHVDSGIRRQITERSVTMLLDMWCMPMLSPDTSVLFNLPLPLYDDKPSATGGKAVLAVESDAFFKWKEHLNVKARLLSPDPSADVVSAQSFERPSGIKMEEPNFFYVVSSAHLSQSDFGILFPWLTKKIFNAQQPERALRLNLRSQLQILRSNGFTVARTSTSDLVDGSSHDNLDKAKEGMEAAAGTDGIDEDPAIFSRSGDTVDCWKWIDIIGLGAADKDASGKTVTEKVEDGEQEVKGEMEPSEQESQPLARTLSAAA